MLQLQSKVQLFIFLDYKYLKYTGFEKLSTQAGNSYNNFTGFWLLINS